LKKVAAKPPRIQDSITTETGLITAKGVVLSRGRRVGTAEGRITDSEGCLLVHGTTTCLIFQR
jgi:acyl-coenzyme A thioesterase PaaI-like protein